MCRAQDGTRLFVTCSHPEGRAERGTILLTHGMGEHSGRYHHVIRRLNEEGMRVVGWDLRGHGRSEGRRGDVPGYGVILGDMQEVWSLARAEAGRTGPLFLYGHSLGGQITLNFAARHRPDASGLIITSPWLRLAFAPPRWKLWIACLAAHTWPSLTQETSVGLSRLSRDLDFLNAMPNLELVHHQISARMYWEVTAGAARALREGVALPYPLLLIHGSADPVTSVVATEQFYVASQSGDKALIIVPGALHETHNDLCRETVLREITGWLDARLPAKAS